MNTGGNARVATRHGPWPALVVIALGYFMNVLDSTVVNVAIPQIVTGVGATTEQILWVVNGYLLPYAMLLLVAGRLGDIRGHRNVFAAGLLVFTAASLVCGLAQNPEQLIAARVLQGIGAAAAAPQALAITSAVFPPAKLGTAFGVLAAVIGSAAAAGPLLGGLISDTLGWRWIFFINIPLGLIGLVCTFVYVPATRNWARQKLGIVPVLLASAGLFVVLYALIEGERFDWGTVRGWIGIPHFLVLGVLILVGFTLWERRRADGLLPRALFTSRNYALMVWASAATYFGIFGSQLVMTIYLQTALGAGPLEAGLVLSPMWLASSLTAPIGGRLSGRVRRSRLLAGGFAVFCLGVAVTAPFADADAAWWEFVAPLVLAGAGAGLTFAPLTTVAMGEVEPQAAGGASGLIEMSRMIGSAVCTAVVGAVLATVWASSLRDGAADAGGRLSGEDRASLIDGARQAADSGLNSGTEAVAPSSLPSGLVRVFEDLSAQSLASAARPALLITAAVIALAAVTSLFLKESGRAGAPAPKEAPVADRAA
ncbi:DHA2 family efflux MFS transporter permease subunit [Streptomyces sp. NPDC000927]|uniref:DHA2 family efflux MFS transporter permease subunit n=1 Tax=unclassified Streptomyces TaxID=2593676 RepID=UPI003323C2A7